MPHPVTGVVLVRLSIVDTLLLLCVAAFIAYRVWESYTDNVSQEARDTQKIALRRAAVTRAPQSPASHESLGDALREAGRYRDALICYENAERMMVEGEATGTGVLGGSGLANKIRLVRMDIRDDAERPASYLEQVARRESVCRQCSTLNAPNETHCTNCGLDLPTNTFAETWIRDDIRKPILREVREGAVIIAVVLFALYLASWMPLEVRGVLLFSTFAVLVWKGLRAITDK